MSCRLQERGIHAAHHQIVDLGVAHIRAVGPARRLDGDVAYVEVVGLEAAGADHEALLVQLDLRCVFGAHRALPVSGSACAELVSLEILYQLLKNRSSV